jgi:glycosyltransferase involved in cell wall biosynthesis
MKVLMVTGSYPPDFCGVGAYTENLVKHLQTRNIDVTAASQGPWLGPASITTVRKLAKMKSDVVHIQYPSVGFGKGLAAQALCLMSRNVVVTIHEASQVHFLRRLALIPFLIKARHLIFTNEFERNYSRRFWPWVRTKSSVIPLGSSIEARGPIEKSEHRIVHFGLIRPQKGIEQVLEAARIAARAHREIRFLIVGTPDKNSKAYSEKLKLQSRGLPIDWQSRLSDENVATILASTRFAYMPFPDGATERRTSLLALYANGVVVATTASEMTSTEMKEASVIANSPDEAVSAIARLMQNPNEELRLRASALAYMQRFSWESISDAHQEIYQRIMN